MSHLPVVSPFWLFSIDEPNEDDYVDQRTEEQLFKQLVHSVKEYAIFALDTSGNIITWNEGAERSKGYSAHEIIGKHFSLFYPVEARNSNHPSFELEMASKNGSYEEEGWRVRKDGSLFWANVLITPLMNETGKHIGFSKVTRNLTEQRRNTEKITEAYTLVTQQKDRLEEFYAILAHELRSPLTSIGGALGLIAGGLAGPVAEESEELIAISRAETERMLRLINELLDLKKIEEGKFDLLLADVRPGQVVSKALKGLQGMAHAAEVELIEHVNENMLVRCDEDKIVQILTNLISNAIKFSPPNSFVEVSVDTCPPEIRFSVKDQGPGIPENRQDKLFEKFYQVQVNQGVFKGTGLGLAIARSIAELHGGTIGFDSHPDSGTTFWLSLPSGDPTSVGSVAL